jgi:hypothetical protein
MNQPTLCEHGLAYVNAHSLGHGSSLDLPFDSVTIEANLLGNQVNLKMVCRYQGNAMVEYPEVVLFRKNVETTITMNGMKGVLPVTISKGI